MTEFIHTKFSKTSHYALMETWATYWWAQDDAEQMLTPDILPDDGLVTKIDGEAAVMSVAVNVPNSRVSMHSYLIASPALDGLSRRQAVNAHIDAVIARSEAQGNIYQNWLCDHRGLLKTLKRQHGFRDGSVTAAVYRAALGAPRIAALEPEEVRA